MGTLKRVGKRLARRVRPAAAFTPYTTERDIDGELLHLHIGDAAGKSWYDRPITAGNWAAEGGEEHPFVRDRMARPGDHVLECGAHHGFYSVLYSRWVTDAGKVLSIEGNPNNVAIAQRNLELNGVSNAEVRNLVVGDHRGRTRIPLVSNSSAIESASALRRTLERILESTVLVPMVPLDDLLDFEPTLVTIDVEGFEILVLRGAERLLQTNPKLVIEVHPRGIHRYGGSVKELTEILALRPYRWWARWPTNELVELSSLSEIVQGVEMQGFEKLHVMGLPLASKPS